MAYNEFMICFIAVYFVDYIVDILFLEIFNNAGDRDTLNVL